MSRNAKSADSIIEALWYGELFPVEDPAFSTPEMKQLLGELSTHMQAMGETCTEEQQCLMEKLDECRSKYESILYNAVFKYAFKLGAKMAIEMLSDSQ